MSYVELQCRSNFSFLHGASHPQELIQRAIEIGLSGLAITDRGGVYGIPKAYWFAKDHPEFKFIVGTQLCLENHPDLTILVQNRAAYGLLCRMLTESHRHQEKGSSLLTQVDFLKFMSESSARGLFAICGEGSNYALLRDLFGGRVFYGLSRFKDGRDLHRDKLAEQVHCEFGISHIATNDVHYHIPQRRKLQDALTSIREGKSLPLAGMKLFSNGERYLKSPFEMKQLFKDKPQALALTCEIADQCTFSPSELRYRYPSEWIPSGHTAQSYLEEQTWKGAQTRYPNGIPHAVKAQVVHELSLISQLHFADYFLTILEIVEFARERKILCQGRGSAANSVVCYCLGITAIDPIRMNLLFERFISVERGEPPDIDIDFEHERREEVIQHIYEKYGRDRAAMVSAVVTYQKRSAFRELSKALGLEVGTLSAKKLIKNFDTIAKSSDVKTPRDWIESLSEEMEGFPRHLSIHSGGFTLSADPITEIVPVEPASMEGRTIIQWDKYDLDYLGLLKVDVLSLGMLSALRKTLDLVGMKLYEIPAEDPATYKMIQHADTTGTFQIESRAQMSMLGRLKPKNFYDLVVEVAIVRPGPIVGKMVHPYLRRRRGDEAVIYEHPKLKQILGKTLGVPLFQEQVMKMAIELGGFNPGEADELRRAIGAWRSSGSIHKMGLKLMEGLQKSGLSPEYAKRVYEQIQGFAQYGFPESHAASFAILAYASCYLKCHHPAEFMCSLVNSQPMGFYSNHTLVDDAKRHGVRVLPVSPQKSMWDCQMEGKDVRLGWRVLSGLAEKSAHDIVAQRPFKDLADFLTRTHLRSDILWRLAMGGGFEDFNLEPRQALWQILNFQVEKSKSQLSLFAGLSLADSDEAFSKLSPFERVKQDYQAFGLSTFSHPMGVLREQVKLGETSKHFRSLKPGATVTVSGLSIVKQRPPTAKGVTFTTLEDEFGFMDLIIHGKTYEKYKTVFSEQCFLTVTGVVQRDGHSVSMLVKKASSVFTPLHIEPDQYFW